jgi:hypothetical protein
MKKYLLVQVYNCDKRRRMMYQVQDSITGEYYHLTEEEWETKREETYSYDQVEVFRVELKARTYVQVIEESHAKTRKGRRK